MDGAACRGLTIVSLLEPRENRTLDLRMTREIQTVRCVTERHHSDDESAKALLDSTERRASGAINWPCSASAAIYVAAMVDSDDRHFVASVIDAVEHSIGASASRPHPDELALELASHPVGVLQQGAGDEVDHGVGNGLCEILGDRSRGRCGNDQLVPLTH